MPVDFHGYELLLLRRLQNDPALCAEWITKLQKKIVDDEFDLGQGDVADEFRSPNVDQSTLQEIPHNLWYLTVILDRRKNRFLQFIVDWLRRRKEPVYLRNRETLLGMYLNSHMFTELHLDGIFKYGDDNTLPIEIFKCPSVKWLSMKYNYLDKIPADIGRMAALEYLALTNNKLQNKSLPHTLTFCSKLKALMLDNNLLDALPGFLLKMSSLKTVHRHGNHNYFKSTFMWYHTDVNERILAVSGVNEFLPREPETLQFWAAKAVIGLKIDFFADPAIATVLKNYISEIYTMFNVCGFCNTAKLVTQPGYKVITFKNPYLGNTCVPFQHWACSIQCAQSIEIPARHEQIAAARELDRQYDKYIRDCQKHYSSHVPTGLRSLSSKNQSNVSTHGSVTSVHTVAQEDSDAGSLTSSCIGTVKPCHCSIS